MAAVKRFVPLADRILVQKLKAEAKSAGGVLLPDSAKQEMNQASVDVERIGILLGIGYDYIYIYLYLYHDV